MDETDDEVLLGTGTDIMVDPVFQTPGARNIADLGTKGRAKMEGRGKGWQSPSHLLSRTTRRLITS